MSKNILMVIDSFGMGGAEKVVLTLSKALIASGNHVDLIIVDDKVELDVPESITIYTLGFKKGLLDYVRYTQKLHTLVNLVAAQYEDGFDGIFVHLQKAARLMRSYRHPKMFFCIHSTISMSSLHGRNGLRLAVKKRRLQKIYNNLNIITVSDGIKNDLLEIVCVKPLSIQTIYNPIDLQEITLLSKEKLATKVEDDYIIHVGRLAESKRHDRLIDAYKVSGIEAKLLIVGEGDMRPTIEKKIVAMDLNDKVIMYGFSSNPYPLIAHAKLLMLTSDYEGLPTVLIEALMLNTPVVSLDCPSGPREILQEGFPDSLVVSSDINVLAKTMKQQYSAVLEEPSVTTIVQKFDSLNIANQYLDLLIKNEKLSEYFSLY